MSKILFKHKKTGNYYIPGVIYIQDEKETIEEAILEEEIKADLQEVIEEDSNDKENIDMEQPTGIPKPALIEVDVKELDLNFYWEHSENDEYIILMKNTRPVEGKKKR